MQPVLNLPQSLRTEGLHGQLGRGSLKIRDWLLYGGCIFEEGLVGSCM